MRREQAERNSSGPCLHNPVPPEGWSGVRIEGVKLSPGKAGMKDAVSVLFFLLLTTQSYTR